MADDVPILLHLTKTAGGTLKSALKKTPGLNTYFIYGRPSIEAFQAERPERLDLVYGHAVYGVHERLGLPPVYGCFLRHPVTRTISHFWHLRNADKGPLGDRMRAAPSIDAFMASENHWEFSNFLCRAISGVGPRKEKPGVLFERAKANIDEHFVFVGFQEFLGESLHRLRGLLNKPVVLGDDVNVGRYRAADISEATLEKIRADNAADLRLYKHCLRKFL